MEQEKDIVVRTVTGIIEENRSQPGSEEGIMFGRGARCCLGKATNPRAHVGRNAHRGNSPTVNMSKTQNDSEI